MKFFKRRSPAAEAPAGPPEVAAAVDVGSGRFEVEVVPEASYAAELFERGQTATDVLPRSMRVVLVAETSNRFNPAAVAVALESGRTLGYLERELAAEVQPLILQILARRQLHAACSARVVLAGERQTLWIDLDTDVLGASARHG